MEHLEQIIVALDLKAKATRYRCGESLKKSRLMEDEPLGAEMERAHALRLFGVYKKYRALHANVVRIKEAIDEAQTVGEIAGHLNVANTVLEEALKNANPEKIEDLMARLEDNTNDMADVMRVLGEEGRLNGGGVYDMDDMLRELEPRMESLVVPAAPPKTRIAEYG